MPPKNLSAFLRREVRKDKLKGVPPLKTKDSAFERLNPDLKFNAEMALLFPELVTEKRGRDDSDVDDRGDKNGGANADESVKASSKAERLKKFLEATSTGMGNKSAQKGEKEGMMVEITGSEVKRNELRILRRELEVLVSNQDSLSVKERRGGKVKRRKLLAEIARLEAEIASSDIERLKASPSNSLPPPISPAETRKLRRTVKLIDKARAGREVRPAVHKRTYDNFNMDGDEDLDGEERLRLGKKLKMTVEEEVKTKRNQIGETMMEKIVVSPEMERLLKLRRKRGEEERRRTVEESERILGEIAGVDGE